MNNLTKDGNIRTRKTCPFLSRCSQVKSDCPKRGNTKAVQHKCGVARLFAAADARRATIATPVVENTPSVEVWNVVAAVNAKRDERNKPDTWIAQHAIANFGK